MELGSPFEWCRPSRNHIAAYSLCNPIKPALCCSRRRTLWSHQGLLRIMNGPPLTRRAPESGHCAASARIKLRLLDHLVDEQLQCVGHLDAEGSRHLQVDDQLEFGRLLDRNSGRQSLPQQPYARRCRIPDLSVFLDHGGEVGRRVADGLEPIVAKNVLHVR